MTPDGLRHLAGGTTHSGGNKTPGMAAPLAVFAATANSARPDHRRRDEGVRGKSGKSSIEGAAKRTADEIAAQLKAGAEKQGWIPAA